jgi:exonuclease SbcD
MKILHTGDWHVRDKDIEEIIQCLSFMVGTAMRETPDLITIAGDIFDSQDIKLDSLSAKLVVRIISRLASLAPVAIVLGTASHDGKAAEILQFVKGDYPVHVASRPEQIYLIPDYSADKQGHFVDIEHLYHPKDILSVLALIPTPTKQFLQGTDQDIGQAMSAVFAGFGAQAAEHDCPHILIGHWNVSGAVLSTGQVMTGRDIEISVDQMMLANPDLVCMGHIHKAQQLGDRTFYSGSIYRNNWGELEDKGFYLHDITETTCGRTVLTNFVKTPTRKLVRIINNFTEEMPIDEFPGILMGACQLNDCEGAFVRYDITVWQDEAGKIDKQAIKEDFMNVGALDVDVRIIRIPRQTVRSEAVLKAETLRDKIQKMAEIKNEECSWSILTKAEALEAKPAEELIKAVGE